MPALNRITAVTTIMNNRLTLRYMPALDGLRAIAIVAVMVYHASPSLMPGGFAGVELFFVLSGFLITGLLLKEQQCHGGIHLGYFYARRLLRLLPALLLLLTVVTTFAYCVLPGGFGSRTLTDSLLALGYCVNWARAFDLRGPSLLGHTWSLSIEEQFYLLWPITLILLVKRTGDSRSLTRVLGLSAAVAVIYRILMLIGGASAVRLYNGLDTRADGLLLGCALGAALSSGMIDLSRPSVRRVIQRATPWAMIGCCWAIWSLSWLQVGTYIWGLPLVSLCTAVLICSVLLTPDGRLSRVLTSRPLVWIGQLSYGLYLWHYPVYRIMGHMGASEFQCLTLGTVITVLAAALSWHLMEKPLLRLKKHFQPGTSSTQHDRTPTPAIAPAT